MREYSDGELIRKNGDRFSPLDMLESKTHTQKIVRHFNQEKWL